MSVIILFKLYHNSKVKISLSKNHGILYGYRIKAFDKGALNANNDVMSIFKYDMLVFCKQYAMGKCYVYCVELDTLDDFAPRVHCYNVSPAKFLKMELGDVFRLQIRGRTIVRMIHEGISEISEADYELLQEIRFRHFEQSSGEQFRLSHYFSYSELQKLMNYHEPLLRRFGLFLLRMLAYALAGLIPIGLYTLLIYGCFSDPEMVYAGLYVALGALPFMIFLVILLYSVTELLLLEWKLTRFGLLRSCALRNCGVKRRLGIERKAARKLVYFGIGSFVFFIVLSIIALVLK